MKTTAKIFMAVWLLAAGAMVCMGTPSITVTIQNIGSTAYPEGTAANGFVMLTVRTVWLGGSGGVMMVPVVFPSLAPGANYVATVTLPPGNNWPVVFGASVMANTACGGLPYALNVTPSAAGSDDASITAAQSAWNQPVAVNQPIGVDWSGCRVTNVPPCSTNLNWNIPNTTSNWVIEAVSQDGVSFQGQQQVAPGASFVFSLTVDCSQANAWQLYVNAPGGDNLVATGITGNNPNTQGSGSGGGTNNTTTAGSGGASTNSTTGGTGSDTSTNSASSGSGTSTNSTSGSGNSGTSGGTGGTGTSGGTGGTSTNTTTSGSSTNSTSSGSSTNSTSSGSSTNSNSGTGSSTNSTQTVTNGSKWILTNYALETSLDVITNAFLTNYGATNPFAGVTFGAYTNQNIGVDTNLNDVSNSVVVEVGGETNYAQAETDSAGMSVQLQGVESGVANFITEMSPLDVEETFAPPDMTFTVTDGLGHALKTIDFNPMDNPVMAQLFNFSKVLWTWGLAISYLVKCTNDAFKALELAENARGTVVTGPTTKKTYT